MNKLLSTLLAGAAALALTGGASAADETARDAGRAPQNQTQGAPVDQAGKDVNTESRESGRDANTGQAAGTVNEGNKDVTAEGRDPKKEEFQAELKKCDPMTGAQKKACIDAAKKKHGQM
jgi:hypothetical protein